jgi:outer membrane protein assembly factor BamE
MLVERFAGITLALLTLNGCALLAPDAERPDTQQGNYLSPAAIERLEVGQSRAQVRKAIGSPILASPFRSDRWDYVYFRSEAGRPIGTRQRLTLYFDQQDRLARVRNRYDPPESTPTDGDTSVMPSVDTSEEPIGTDGPGRSPGPGQGQGPTPLP